MTFYLPKYCFRILNTQAAAKVIPAAATFRNCLNFYHLRFYDVFTSRFFLFIEEDSRSI